MDQDARQRRTCVNLPPKAKRMKIQTIDFHTKYRNMCNSMRIEVAIGWLFGYWARRIENRWERSPGVATEPVYTDYALAGLLLDGWTIS